MKTSPLGLQKIKSAEGFRARPYICPAGKPTIGYGSTFYPNGRLVTTSDKMITEHEASVMLEANLARYEREILRLVKVPLTQGQFDALVSFCYNLGTAALGQSTLLKYLNEKHYQLAAEEFPKWCKARSPQTGKMVELAGLKKRRLDEREMFLGAA